MSEQVARSRPLLAADVGSSRIKLGIFLQPGACESPPGAGQLPMAAPRLPVPSELLVVAHRGASVDLWQKEIADWLDAQIGLDEPDSGQARCVVASVAPAAAEQLLEGPLADWGERLIVLTGEATQVPARVDRPQQVGIDRLLNAAAARRLCHAVPSGANRPLIIVDAGTAITVDLVSSDGALVGGAILPGGYLQALALHRRTACLPMLDRTRIEAGPPPLGKSTEAAIASGICWGVVGGIRELVARLARQQVPEPQVVITGGDAHWLAPLLSEQMPQLQHVAYLTLSGMAVVAEHLS